MTRAERAEEAARLRAEGLRIVEVAERMGLSRSYTGALLDDPDGTKDRARKDRYRGRCEGCGGPTSGTNGPGRAARLCGSCSLERQRARAKWTPDTIALAFHLWIAVHGFQPSAADWNPATVLARGLPHAQERADRYRAGDWPPASSVLRVFGAWSAAVAYAGLPPLPCGSPAHRDRLDLAA